MKKRTFIPGIALLLTFLIALSGCGMPAPVRRDAGDAYAPVLQSGTLYAVYNESGAPAAFLQPTGHRSMTVFDSDGTVIAGLACAYSAEDGYYYVDGQPSFSVRARRDSLALISAGGVPFAAGSYTLLPSTLPAPTAAPVESPTPPTPVVTESPVPVVESPAPVETVEPVPEEVKPVLISAGDSYALYDGDELVNYMVFGNDTLTILYSDGYVSSELGYVYDNRAQALVLGSESLPLDLEEDGAVYLEESNARLRMEEISRSQIPIPDDAYSDPDTADWTETVLATDGGYTLKALLPSALLEQFSFSGTESQATYATESGVFYLSAFLYSGADMAQELASMAEEAGLDPADLDEETLFGLYQAQVLEDAGEVFDALGLTPELEITTGNIRGIQWRWLNYFGGYKEAQINDLYLFLSMDGDRLCVVMTMAQADGDNAAYQETVEELVYGWLLSIPASMTLE